jgi:hypothetical protein
MYCTSCEIRTEFIYVEESRPFLQKQTPWPESASELYRPSNSRLSAKLVSTFADRKWRVSVTDPYGHNLGFLDRRPFLLSCIILYMKKKITENFIFVKSVSTRFPLSLRIHFHCKLDLLNFQIRLQCLAPTECNSLLGAINQPRHHGTSSQRFIGFFASPSRDHLSINQSNQPINQYTRMIRPMSIYKNGINASGGFRKPNSRGTVQSRGIRTWGVQVGWQIWAGGSLLRSGQTQVGEPAQWYYFASATTQMLR